MSRDKDPEKWAAAAAVCAEFRSCMARGECDQLCRIATHTVMLYGKISESYKEGDTPEFLNERVLFTRSFRDNMYDEARQWDAAISDIARTRRRVVAGVWICPRCGREDCSGAIRLAPDMVFVKKQ